MSIRIGIGLDVFGAGIDADATTIYNRIIADGGVSNLTRLNFFVKGLKAIYGDLANVPVCYDAHWIGYKLGSGTGATAGQAAAKLYSLTVAGDAVQSTAASQPLLLSHNGDNYWYGSGVANNDLQTASSYAFPTTSGLTVSSKIYIHSTNARQISSKDNGGGAGRVFIQGWNGTYFSLAFGNGFIYNALSTVPTAVGYDGWIKTKAYTSGADMKVEFYLSSDNITYTQLGTTVTVIGAGNSIQVGSTPYRIGSNNGANAWDGRIYRSLIYDANDVLLRDFNPATYNASTSQTQWTSATGEVWTINTGTATTGYKGQLVSKTIVMSDGVDDFISVTGMTSRQYFTRYVACIPYTNPNTAPRIISGNADTHLIFKTGAGAFEAFNGAQLAFTGEVVNILQALIVDYNSTNSKTFVNNANETSGNTGTTSSTAISLFGSVTGTTLSNAVINTVIQSIAVDNATNRTAVYNLIRSLNNNAF